MDDFVSRANVEHFLRLIAEETDADKREVLEQLLAEEQSKLQTGQDRPAWLRDRGPRAGSGSP